MSFRKFVGRGVLGAVAVAALCASSSCARTTARRADRLKIALPYEATTLDPHATFTLSNLAILFNFYEPLVSFDPEMRVTPCLARSWENPDPETWVFHLRPGVRFHGGKALDSSDVKYSFDRLLRRTDLEMSGFLVSIDRVDAIDPLTVRIRTKRPFAILLSKIVSVAIVPNGSTDAWLARSEDGTGPYRLARFRPSALEMVRSESYWGPRPWASEATYLLGSTPARAIELIRSRQASLVQNNTRTARAAAESQPDLRVLRVPDVFMKHLGYDFSRAAIPGVEGNRNPFRDIRVRRALDLAIDRDELATRLPASAVPLSQLSPPFIFGFDSALPAARTDRPQAARLLAEAGYPSGFEVRLDVRQLFEPAAREVARQLARVGIRAGVSVHSDAEYSSAGRRRATSFFLERFGCTTGDISDILDNVIHTPDPVRHYGIYNTVGYSNPEIDGLIEESAGVANPTARRELLQSIVGRVMRDLVMIPLYVDEDVYFVDRSLAWRPRNDGMVLAAEIRPASLAANPGR